MPLSINLDINNTGVPATYWVVNRINIDFVQNTASIFIDGYGVGIDYVNGLAPLYSTCINASGSTNPLTRSALTAALNNVYNDLLNYPLFSGANII
jgi:hypothetical protein